jgi:hypothetical protein
MNLSQIIEAIAVHRMRVGGKAFDDIAALGLSVEEISYSVLHGEIAEEYAGRRCPTCLIHGPTFGDDPLHSLWACNLQSGWAACLGVCRPGEEPK